MHLSLILLVLVIISHVFAYSPPTHEYLVDSMNGDAFTSDMLVYGGVVMDGLRETCYYLHSVDMAYYFHQFVDLTLSPTQRTQYLPLAQGMVAHMAADAIAHCSANVFTDVWDYDKKLLQISIDAYVLKTLDWEGWRTSLQDDTLQDIAALFMDFCDFQYDIVKGLCDRDHDDFPTYDRILSDLETFASTLDTIYTVDMLDFIYKEEIEILIANGTCSDESWSTQSTRLQYQLDSSVSVELDFLDAVVSYPGLRVVEDELDALLEDFVESVSGNICCYPPGSM